MIMKLNLHLKLVEQPEMKYIGEIKLEILTIDAFRLTPKTRVYCYHTNHWCHNTLMIRSNLKMRMGDPIKSKNTWVANASSSKIHIALHTSLERGSLDCQTTLAKLIHLDQSLQKANTWQNSWQLAHETASLIVIHATIKDEFWAQYSFTITPQRQHQTGNGSSQS